MFPGGNDQNHEREFPVQYFEKSIKWCPVHELKRRHPVVVYFREGKFTEKKTIVFLHL
jgi:hypothetical protein